MVEAEGKKSLGRFPFGQTNRRALRLQAQGSTVAPSGARRNPAYDRVPRVQFPPPCWPTKKNRPPDGFSGCYGGGVRQEIAWAISFSQTNRRALRLQAQFATQRAVYGAKPCYAPRPAGSIPAALLADEKKPSTGRFFRMLWWRRRESNPRPQALYRQFYILSTAI